MSRDTYLCIHGWMRYDACYIISLFITMEYIGRIKSVREGRTPFSHQVLLCFSEESVCQRMWVHQWVRKSPHGSHPWDCDVFDTMRHSGQNTPPLQHEVIKELFLFPWLSVMSNQWGCQSSSGESRMCVYAPRICLGVKMQKVNKE